MMSNTAKAAQRRSKVGRLRTISLTSIRRSTSQKHAALMISFPAKSRGLTKRCLVSVPDTPVSFANRGTLAIRMHAEIQHCVLATF